MKTSITDFRFTFQSAGHYVVYYYSPKTSKGRSRLVTDMTIIDEFKGTETSDHTQTRLNWLKKYIKN
jgi:hypothetical protein